MMGYEDNIQPKLYYNFRLNKKIPENHQLRKIKKLLDLKFLYPLLKDKYGYKGNVSVPPPTLMKMMFLLVMYNVRSERELIDTIPMRLDWLWFLNYDIDSEIPNHSVLSKARKRWGESVFRELFEKIIKQAVEKGFIDGEKIFADASMVSADASINSVKTKLELHLDEKYNELLSRLEDREYSEVYKSQEVNKKKISTTDPEATLARNKGRSKLSYKTHRTVDGKNEIITTCETTTGTVDEASMLIKQIDKHTSLVEKEPKIAIADSKYGTKSNFIELTKKEITPHIRNLADMQKNPAEKGKIFHKEEFKYDSQKDEYKCPAGKTLSRRSYNKLRNWISYKASPKDCKNCKLRDRCTKNKSGKEISRHPEQEILDKAIECSRSNACKEDLKLRQHLMERSYGTGSRYGYQRARWRSLEKVSIQQLLVAIVQNLQKMAKITPKRGINATVLRNIFSTFKLMYIKPKNQMLRSLSICILNY